MLAHPREGHHAPRVGRLRIDRLTPAPGRLRGPDGAVVVGRCHVAASPLTRLVGLLGTPDLGADEGLWLEPCSGLHTLGLRARIGGAFLDADGRVMRVVDPLPPWRVAAARGARAAVEAPAGRLAGLVPGDVVRLEPPEPAELSR